MSPTIRRHVDAAGFLERAEPVLARAEAEHNLLLGIARALREEPVPGAYFATIERGGEVLGAAVRQPPRKLVLGELPADALDALAADVFAVSPDLPAVLGPNELAEAFARSWAKRTGAQPRAGMRQRIYRLDRVAETPVVPGRLRHATRDDVDLLARWTVAFASDARVEVPDDPIGFATYKVEQGLVHVWEDDEPVSIAAWRPAGVGCSCVSLVYTPAVQRGRGYATACVAALSRLLLEGGSRFCVLFTDLANPTSNRIYRRIGYRPVIDVMDWELGPAVP